MDDTSQKRLERKLSPQTVAGNLQRASLFLVAYELLRAAIVDQVRGFYVNGMRDGKLVYDERSYEADVSARHKKVFQASCLWLQEQNVFTADDVAELQLIREHRDRIAHELPQLMVDPEFEIDMSLLERARYHLGAVGRYWGALAAEFGEIPPEEVDYEGVMSMSMLLLEYIISSVSEADG